MIKAYQASDIGKVRENNEDSLTLNISAIANNITYGQDLVVSHVLNVGDAVGSVVLFC